MSIQQADFPNELLQKAIRSQKKLGQYWLAIGILFFAAIILSLLFFNSRHQLYLKAQDELVGSRQLISSIDSLYSNNSTNTERKYAYAKVITLIRDYNDDAIRKRKDSAIAFMKGFDSLQSLSKKIASISTFTDSAKPAESKQILSKLDDLDKQINKLQNTKKITSNNPLVDDSIKTAESSAKTLITSSPTIESAYKITTPIPAEVIKQVTKTTTDNNNDKFVEVKDYGVSWFKTGYFLQFGEMRVLLQYLDKSLGIQVQICETTSSAPCDNPLKTKTWISYDTPLTVTVANKKYKIALKAIDHAGYNPFNLAAFINVTEIADK